MSNILFELGFEELPVDEITNLYNHIESNLKEQLIENGYDVKPTDNYNVYQTPRRLVIYLKDIDEQTAEQTVEMKGPPENIFYAGGSISPQGMGFLKSKGLAEEDVEVRDGFVYYSQAEGGEKTTDILSSILKELLSSVPFSKTMTWPGSDIRFSRPVRWILFMEDDAIIKFEFAGIKSDNKTYGNRTTGNRAITVKSTDDYRSRIEEHYVMLSDGIDSGKRYGKILEQIRDYNEKSDCKIEPDIGKMLITENSLLTEWPVLITGEFDERFLNLPAPILTTAMRQHQRYFAVIDKDNNLTDQFAFISNNPNADEDSQKMNHQRVLSARLEDAEFYFNNDMKRTLDDYSDMLDDIVYFRHLGTYSDKIERISGIASHIEDMISDDRRTDWNELALIAKFDIATDMIKDGKEFTKLQGTIGYHYALEMGIEEGKARVAREHYRPEVKGSCLPDDDKSRILSIADKIDAIAGAFIAGYKPTGSKDIMGVRRTSLAIIYMMYELGFVDSKWSIDIAEIIKYAYSRFDSNEHFSELIEYMRTRLQNYLSNEQSISPDIIRCVTKTEQLTIDTILDKARIIQEQKDNNLNDFRTMVTGLKRVNNILKEYEPGRPLSEDMLKESYSKELLKKALGIEEKNRERYNGNQYTKALDNLLELRKPIDDFFDNVMVMDKDIKIRELRLSLLYRVREVFSQFGDFSEIVFDDDNGDE
ncbi:MAG: glycine--tRNA ligase subunit beta [candidate division WOR-3 bacterium]|nr:glycine--tRNA ligase subunit beta [candidate division WOR-3 bacterium]